jgi:hypothetical protein
VFTIYYFRQLSRSGSGIWDEKYRIGDKHLGSFLREITNNFFWLKLKNAKKSLADPNPRTGAFLALDPGCGMEKLDPG